MSCVTSLRRAHRVPVVAVVFQALERQRQEHDGQEGDAKDTKYDMLLR